MKSIDFLITGGAGFIGSNTARYLLHKGFRVRVLDNFVNGRESNLQDIKQQIDIAKGSICDPETVLNSVKNVRFVLHMAALSSVEISVSDPTPSSEVNVQGTLELLKAAKQVGVERLILSSSCSVYGRNASVDCGEETSTHPLSPYALTKLMNEQQCRLFSDLYGLSTVCLRYFNAYGPSQRHDSPYAAVIPVFANKLSTGHPLTIYGDGEQTRDFVFVSDIAAANLNACLCADVLPGEVFNIASGNRLSINALAKLLGEKLSYASAQTHRVPPRPGEIRHSGANISKAMARLDWKPKVAFDEGLDLTLQKTFNRHRPYCILIR